MALYSNQRATIDAIGDVLNEFNGWLLTRLTRTLPPALLGSVIPPNALEAQVETTLDTDAAGSIQIRGETIPYAAKTNTLFQTLTRDDSVRATYREGELVALLTGNYSWTDKAKASLTVDGAEGSSLDVVGGNLGVGRIRSVVDAQYRNMIKALAYQRGRGTWTAIGEALDLILAGKNPTGADGVLTAATGVLTAATGAWTTDLIDKRIKITGPLNGTKIFRIFNVTGLGAMTLDPRGGLWYEGADPLVLVDETNLTWEIVAWDLWTEVWPNAWGRRNTVKLRLNCPKPTDTLGYAYFQGGEPLTSLTALSVVTTHAIRQVLGVYLVSDELRLGTNYATTNTFGGSTITLDAPLPGANTDVLVDYGSIESPTATVPGVPGSATGPAVSQLLEDVNTVNSGSPVRYPLYLGDRVGFVRSLMDLITVAGVIPETVVTTF